MPKRLNPALSLAAVLGGCAVHPAPDVTLDMQHMVAPGPGEATVPGNLAAPPSAAGAADPSGAVTASVSRLLTPPPAPAGTQNA